MILHFHERTFEYVFGSTNPIKKIWSGNRYLAKYVENKFVNQDKITYCFQGHVLTYLRN